MSTPTAVEDQPTGQNEPWPWVYVPEACEILGKSPVTLQRWRMDEFGPPSYKNGNRVVYKRADLMDWMLGRTD